jgi:hypothetical protein
MGDDRISISKSSVVAAGDAGRGGPVRGVGQPFA